MSCSVNRLMALFIVKDILSIRNAGICALVIKLLLSSGYRLGFIHNSYIFTADT